LSAVNHQKIGQQGQEFRHHVREHEVCEGGCDKSMNANMKCKKLHAKLYNSPLKINIILKTFIFCTSCHL